jgi:quercetin dioxygenase-like cupin family protein
VNVGGNTVLYSTFEPGWRWSLHVKPLAGTGSCQASHLMYIVSGRMAVVMDDGTTGEVGPGDVVAIAPGHDGWVVGNEACVAVDFGGYAQYAKS